MPILFQIVSVRLARILQGRVSDSRGIAIGVVPDIALVYLGD